MAETARIIQQAIQVVTAGPAAARVSQQAIQVVWTLPVVPTGGSSSRMFLGIGL